jgi:hypothetical protein
MLRVGDYEFVSLLTDKEGIGRTVNVYPSPEKFTAMPMATSGKNQRAEGYQVQTQEPFHKISRSRRNSTVSHSLSLVKQKPRNFQPRTNSEEGRGFGRGK